MVAETGRSGEELVREGEFRWVLPRQGDMRVPGVVFADQSLLPQALGDRSLLQVANVATLPGIVRASYAMPDVHWGYGFPIGGVAATDVAEQGVVSPGGVGFDISCGVRLLVTDLDEREARSRLPRLMGRLLREIPAGAGKGGLWEVDRRTLEAVLREGAAAAVAAGFGEERDLERCEDGGRMEGAEPDPAGARAMERGAGQLGSLGSGNHFLEVQVVRRVLEPEVAAVFGLEEGRVAVMIHSGSRGFGHQVCTEHVREMLRAQEAYGLRLPDPQLAAAPADSPHGRRYLAAMAAAANFGRANRQLIAWAVRREMKAVYGCDLDLVYDVSHNLAKLEEHEVGGAVRRLCVHRKGATLALPAGDPRLPACYRDAGQPVLVPGSMGTASYVLVGLPGNEAFTSTCHGAGRTMSRHQAMKGESGPELRQRLGRQGVLVETRAVRSLPEESPEAYKDVDAVVRACAGAGLSRPVARLTPIAVLKG